MQVSSALSSRPAASFVKAVIRAAAAVTVSLLLSTIASAQGYKFTGGADGALAVNGLTMDPAGDYYGTTALAGTANCGTIFKLRARSNPWQFSLVYSFHGGSDGCQPGGGIVFGPDGRLYGVTYFGGGAGCGGSGCGTVYRLAPPDNGCSSVFCQWNEEVIHTFTGSDGMYPVGDLTFDHSGNIYGATASARNSGGIVYELTPLGDQWTLTAIHEFTQVNDGAEPQSGVVFDAAGSLFGTTGEGGSYGYGTVYEMTPAAGGGWNEQVLIGFQVRDANGYGPVAPLLVDSSGNLYGSTVLGGAGQGGTVFKLSRSSGGWAFSVVYDGAAWWGGPFGMLTMDADGNLYGAASGGTDIHHFGSIFKLTNGSDGWSYTSLHDFTGGIDGGLPKCNVVFDANGNLHGTAEVGGIGPCNGGWWSGCGVVW